MKLLLPVALSSLASMAGAQIHNLPPCALGCLTSAFSAAGCAFTDTACLCGPRHSSIGDIAGPCLMQSCPATVLASIRSVGLANCAPVTLSSSSLLSSTSFETSVAASSMTAPSTTSNSISRATTEASTITAIITSLTTTSQAAIKSYPFSQSLSTSSSVSASQIANPTSSTVVDSNSSISPGLSAGAKVGIAIEVVAGVAVIVTIVIILCLARRRSERKRGASADIDLVRPEMPTEANTHELSVKSQSHVNEMSGMPSPQNLMSSALYELSASSEKSGMTVFEVAPVTPQAELPSSANTHEIGTQSSPLQRIQPMSAMSNPTFSHGIDTAHHDSSATEPLPTETISHYSHLPADTPLGIAALSSSSITPASSTENAPSKLEAMQARMDRIRSEKERLLKLQELEEMEAALQREIMKEQKREEEK